ncbi:MAG: sensor histidine kinase [Polyangiaceae bacterium]
MAAHNHESEDAGKAFALTGASDPSKLQSELANVVEDGPVPLVVQRRGRIVYANAAARRDFPGEVDEGNAFMSVERFHADDRALFADAQTRASSGTLWRGTLRLAHPSEDFRPAQVTIFSVDFGGPALAYFVRDLSLDLEEKAHLFVNSRSASAAVLAAGVAHEINNPLATIMTNLGFVFDQLRLLRDEMPDAPPPAHDRIQQSLDALEDTHASGLRIETVIRDLRAFVPDGEARTAVAVNEAVRVALRRADAELDTTTPLVTDFGDPPAVDANAARLVQIFFNLIVNAVEATPRGETRRNEVRVSTRSLDGCAVVSVSDTGKGIPANVRPHIFDAFVTTKPQGEGMGLGLFVVHAVVASLKGRIEVDTVIPTGLHDSSTRGTKFTLFLPGLAEPPRSRKSLK